MTDGAAQVVGLDRFRRTLRQAADDVDELADGHAKAAAIIADAARGRAPKLTGRLARSVRPVRQDRRARVTAGGPGVPYAARIHRGWRNVRPQPFLTDAIRTTEPRWMRVYLDDVQDALDQVKGA